MKKKYSVILAILILIFTVSASVVQASPPYKSYTYTYTKNVAWAAPAPVPYVPSRIIDSKTIGAELTQPEDMFFAKDGSIYIVNGGFKGNILVLDSEWNLKKVIDQFDNNGKADKFNNPTGVFVTDKGDIYVADMNNGRVVVLDKDGNYKREYGKPTDVTYNKDVHEYKPKKVAVDSNNNIFLIVQGDNNGIVEINEEGYFEGYVGANKVKVNPALVLWKRIMTKEQVEQLEKFVPQEYSNLSLDDQGFIYALAATEGASNPIKRLNPTGEDVLVRNGWTGVNGDTISTKALYNQVTGDSGLSLFADITSDSEGYYSALDGKRGRIFTYNKNGDLLYVFGGMGSQKGTFGLPVAIENRAGKIYVVDKKNKNITEFEVTEYAKLIRQADSQYLDGQYEDCMETWKKVLKMNANFELAYVQTGNVYLRQQKYEEAMKYYMLGNYRGNDSTGYSKAFDGYKKQFLRQHFSKILTIAVILFVGLYVFIKIRNRRKKKDKFDITMEGVAE